MKKPAAITAGFFVPKNDMKKNVMLSAVKYLFRASNSIDSTKR